MSRLVLGPLLLRCCARRFPRVFPSHLRSEVVGIFERSGMGLRKLLAELCNLVLNRSDLGEPRSFRLLEDLSDTE